MRATPIPSDSGVSLILEQDIGESLLVFGRYGYADRAIANVRNMGQLGLGVRGLFGSPDNLLDSAGGIAEPSGDRRNEGVFEVFQRWQVTRHTQFTAGAQLIIDPSNSPDVDTFGVFSLRLRVAF